MGVYMRGQGEDRTLEAQWRALPNYVKEGSNVLVMADTSGSMTCAGGRPPGFLRGLGYLLRREKCRCLPQYVYDF